MRLNAFIAVLMALLLAGSPAFAGKGDVCRTPDGFIFAASNGNGMGGTGAKMSERKGMGGTGINGNGMGGTGAKFAERNGMGGTGITGDIGVYGRITAFGSICVNGMEIEYKKSTPVSDEGRNASARDLQIGQMVAVRAYKDKSGEFKARRIMIDKVVSGRATQIDHKRGVLHVMKDTVLVGPKARDQIRTLREGDYIAVSGLRRNDGVIVASHIERSAPNRSARQQSPASLFGSGIKHFSMQGYVRSSGRDGKVTMTDGTVIRMSKDAKDRPHANERVIIFGDVSNNGQFTAETIVPEVKTILPVLELPLIKGENGLLGPGGIQLPLLSPNGNSGTELALPSLPGGGIGVPSVDVPAVNVPSVDVPGLPPVDLPPIDVPALPPVEIPVPPVDIPVIPVPPVIPDLPILPGH